MVQMYHISHSHICDPNMQRAKLEIHENCLYAYIKCLVSPIQRYIDIYALMKSQSVLPILSLFCLYRRSLNDESHHEYLLETKWNTCFSCLFVFLFWFLEMKLGLWTCSLTNYSLKMRSFAGALTVNLFFLLFKFHCCCSSVQVLFWLCLIIKKKVFVFYG